MPLAFDSINHGKIAFGFFNIETDMLLLENYFIFATQFCNYLRKIACEKNSGGIQTLWEVDCIQEASEIGDLIGAIHGFRYTGFIGETYRRFPFPSEQEAFKQQTDGYKNQTVIREMICKYAQRIEIPFQSDDKAEAVSIGIYQFSRKTWHELIEYVWRGGYPRWRDEKRPDYVLSMKKSVTESLHPLFKGLKLVRE